ncbi:tyrosine-protein phosphatase [Nocardiopsis sp. NRRL B-16309]|uniref:tyrosine-protein phosphatase n=1 Tax=Nocardiopsis sp. NRRL B-16309 TaxID=1519494 RepID=UPI000B14D505|nr:tyrosine-protein phosphatase [Nocardiopsis sp. NRRL B-16309]
MTSDGFILPSAPNFRDLGGLRSGSGRTVRHGLLYRSDALHSVSTEDLAVYHGLGIRQLVDLRTPVERERLPDLVPDGAEYAVVAVQGQDAAGANFTDTLADPEAARAMFADGAAERFMYAVYRELVADDEALAGYRELVERVATGPSSLVFHCSAGKDRTGWGAAVVLGLLGVDRADILADYLASNERQANTDAWMRRLSVDSGLAWDDVAPMTRVRAEYLETAFGHVDELFGSFDQYVADGLKVSESVVERLRDRLLR